jgi:glycine/D-amino acid oxidase-like deaminating enzyme
MTPKHEHYDVLVAGGGFFGLYIGEFLALHGKRVLICEQGPRLMRRASYNNQARVHSGYHYPRSLLTAMRSCISFPKFVAEFPDCVVSDFEKYYAIGKILGKVNARQFQRFCDLIGAPCDPAPSRIQAMFSPHFIEAVFSTREYAFNADKLCLAMQARLQATSVEILTDCAVERVCQGPPLSAELRSDGVSVSVKADEVYNCTYSHINYLIANSGIEPIPLKHEMTEMALVTPPEALADKGVTVMCGPFFSIMPFPHLGLCTLSHVRYTPHYEWHDKRDVPILDSYRIHGEDPKQTHFTSMQLDASRYLPCLQGCQYRDSLWEVKTLLPASEIDDSRPILFKTNYGMNSFHCIMGGKIDNVYDVVEAIKQMKGWA